MVFKACQYCKLSATHAAALQTTQELLVFSGRWWCCCLVRHCRYCVLLM